MEKESKMSHAIPVLIHARDTDKRYTIPLIVTKKSVPKK